jgi:hypothetical protein
MITIEYDVSTDNAFFLIRFELTNEHRLASRFVSLSPSYPCPLPPSSFRTIDSPSIQLPCYHSSSLFISYHYKAL